MIVETIMKNIILATDFSLNAQIAAVCAGEITRLIGARLVIFFALSPLIISKGKTPLFESEVVMQKKLDKLAREMNKRFGISVTRLIKPGFPVDEICALSERLSAKAIITGMKGESDKKDHQVGSVSRELLSKENTPIICIPAVESLDLSETLAYLDLHKQEFCNKSGRTFLEELLIQNPSGQFINKNLI